MIKIIGTGSYLPEKILTNKELESMVDTTDEWIQQRSGIRERRIAHPHEATSDLAVNAAKKALEMANMKPSDIQLIIVGTSTPDHSIPAVAPIVQHKLGCDGVFAYDLNSVCTSFAAAFLTAYSIISSGFYQNCLIIGADTYSRILNWQDRSTCVLFGDGAGAMILEHDKNKKGILSHSYKAKGESYNAIIIPVGGSRKPFNKGIDGYKREDCFFTMEGKKVYEFTITCIPAMAEELLEKANLKPSEIDWIVLHQANYRIIQAVSKKLGLPKEKFIVNVERVGNTSSASIPIALDEAYRDGRIQAGHKVMMIGFGGGLSWGGVIIEW